MRAGRACLIIAVLTLAACGQPEVASMPTPPSPVGFSLALQLSTGNQQGPGLASPISVHLIARGASGHLVTIVGGELVVRDSDGVPLAQVAVPANSGGQASVDLAWTQGATLGRRLDVRVNVLDADGAAHVVERMLTL
jgi:hypothetical protein